MEKEQNHTLEDLEQELINKLFEKIGNLGAYDTEAKLLIELLKINKKD